MRVLQYIRKEEQKSKEMNYCIDIHNTMSDCMQMQEQRLLSEGQYKEQPQKRKQSPKKGRGKKSNFVWTVKEQRSYVSFLKSERELFRLSPKERKIVKINLQMSDRVKTRTAPQCHSHHQKMMKKYGTIEAIISANKHLYFREKRQDLKREREEAPFEEQIAQKPHESKEPVEVIEQKGDSNRPIWWQYFEIMESPLQGPELKTSHFDSLFGLFFD